jgi:hypothetical protein
VKCTGVRRAHKVKYKCDVPSEAPSQRFVRRHALPIMLAAAAVIRALVAIGIPPGSDVYYFLTEGARTLLSGGNPYQHTYTSIPSNLITPGAHQVFAYLPATLLYLAPFLLAGDVRLGVITADLIIGACLYLYGGRWHLAAAFIYFFLPFVILFSTVFLNATVIAMAFIAAFFVLESRGRGALGAVSFGVALATVQFSLLVVPCLLVYYVRRGRWVEPLIMIATALLITAPFLLLSPRPLVQETIFFQFGRSPAPLLASGGLIGLTLNPSLSAMALAAFGVRVPLYVKAVAELAVIAVFARVTDTSSLARNSAFLVIVSVIILPDDFFWSYLELPFMFLLFWLSAPKSLDLVKIF